MKKSRFTDSQIIDALKRAEAGLAVPELCRELGISAATFCIDPAVSAQVRPLMQMLERAFSSSAPGGDADGYRS